MLSSTQLNSSVLLHGPHIHTSSYACTFHLSLSIDKWTSGYYSINETFYVKSSIQLWGIKYTWDPNRSMQELQKFYSLVKCSQRINTYNLCSTYWNTDCMGHKACLDVGPDTISYDVYCNLLVYLCSCILTIFTYLYLVIWKSTAKQ
jgi:hypothetical protein